MKIIFGLLCIAYASLFARENPFFPLNDTPVPAYSTNNVKKPPPFRSTQISLPDSARILQSVTVTFVNLDGSIGKKEVRIDKSVDWHRQLVLTQSQAQSAQPRTLKQKRKAGKKIARLRFISFVVSGKKMSIITRDKLLRHFKLVKPDRIVLDFRRDADFRTYTFRGASVFKRLTIGNHSGYYRVVVELDGRYAYGVRPTKNGYTLYVR